MDLIEKSCDKAIWLNKGQIKLAGESADVVKSYLDCVI
jgi:lipopolysaccharide transport system ATP-binding protein